MRGYLMRRAFGQLLPVLLIALAVQLLAPIGLTFAAAITVSDPLHGSPLCSGRGNAAQADDPSIHHHCRDGSCAACFAAASAPPPAPNSLHVTVERHVYRVAWRAFLPGTLAARAASFAQPRGPPILS